ncbi:hypothetical protein RGU76_12030 [Bacillus pseudomycoides]|nr:MULTISPECIES: hypothetical protein [Bacillus]MCX2824495.1 hypothetical protein [Bacillus sp. DHT2]MDR4915770.1 hypothetical protein [Bacillus pseudomycoides]
MQRKRRKNEGLNTDIRYEFNEIYRQMIKAGSKNGTKGND